METGHVVPPKASFLATLRAGLRETWDRLGLVLCVSMTWTVLLFVPLTAWRYIPVSVSLPGRVIIALILSAAVLSAPTAGISALVHRVYSRDEYSYVDMWRGARRMFLPATRLGVAQAVIWGVLGTNLLFYLRMGGVAGMVVSLICLYIILFWAMMSTLLFPLLAAQEDGVFDEEGRPARRGALAVFRRAFYLVMGSPFYLIGVTFSIVALTALMVLSGVLFACAWAGVAAFISTAAVRALLVQYEIIPAPSTEDAVPDEAFRIKT